MQLIDVAETVIHGADLQRAIKQFGGEPQQWLDLSSAVSPYCWWSEQGKELSCPVSFIHELPGIQPELNRAIRTYYGHEGLLVPGSQRAIAELPGCFSRGKVWSLAGTYGEHASCWKKAGHSVYEKTADDIRQAFNAVANNNHELPDMLVLVNPGNPGGERFSAAELHGWAEQLKQRQAWLLCDEAFMDCTPDDSLLTQTLADNMLVLRSLGKFFGLAGLRIGVVFATADVLQNLANRLGPWPVAGHSLWLAQQALSDESWIAQQRSRLKDNHALMAQWLNGFFLAGKSNLFFTLKFPNAERVQTFLAERYIWSRCFKQQQLIRLGLVGDDACKQQQLQQALNELREFLL
ncbi:aminotransferase class I/II-fold pyridoxal phosphate-dependent enzyme [Thalassolituus pacificus]|uniref:Aminotransferase n=1 Tax=Thalassolituus pacificus TaxID=2975440 RepID=A0A9X3AFS8_9GAMM|nr:aminotransferase class I/II-fold pyridoxal phosphate-dependent enzyme [Thalassolituus pacificus]MCT7358081.1 aminotransferase class I/II-fold pyridoxal phosphate-dependent enzyme [Thalassolituus pacificus]